MLKTFENTDPIAITAYKLNDFLKLPIEDCVKIVELARSKMKNPRLRHYAFDDALTDWHWAMRAVNARCTWLPWYAH
jgi:hypothetical protein